MMIVPELVHLARQHRGRFRRVTAALIGVSLTHLVQAFAIAGTLTAVVQGRPGLGAACLAALALAAGVRLLLRLHQQRLASGLGATVRQEMRARVLRRILVPGRLHDVRGRAGSARLTVVDAVDGVDTYLTRYLPHVAQVAVFTPLLILAAAVFSPAAAGALTGFVLLAVAAPRAFNRWMAARSQERWESYDDLSADVQESLQGMRTLQLLGAVPARRRSLRRRSARLHRETVRTMRASLWETGILDLMIQAGTAVAAGLAILTAAGAGGGLLATPVAAVSDDPFRIFAILMLASETFRPLREVSQQWHAGFLGLSSVGTLRAHGAFDTAPSAEDAGDDEGDSRRHPVDRSPEGQTPGLLRLEELHHQYPRTVAPVLRGVDAEFAPSRIAVLSGSSGAGKSTLFDIILGLLEPEGGQISLEGRRPRAQDIAVVSQAPSLFSGTLRENLCLAAPDDVDTASILRACEDAGLTGLLAELPAGLDTAIAEGGSSLSRGQAQRVAIARAYLAGRPVILLDEPTSALDEDNAGHVLIRLRARAEGRIVLIISHRDDVTAVADDRWHLERGRLSRLGVPDPVTPGPFTPCPVTAGTSPHREENP